MIDRIGQIGVDGHIVSTERRSDGLWHVSVNDFVDVRTVPAAPDDTLDSVKAKVRIVAREYLESIGEKTYHGAYTDCPICKENGVHALDCPLKGVMRLTYSGENNKPCPTGPDGIVRHQFFFGAPRCTCGEHESPMKRISDE